MQLHLQVSPADFANNWNAAQVLAGPQLALGANSPYFFGHQLWSETRIELFAQSTDTRPDELKTQGVRPRVWFGERWITSIFDLFEENVRYFPSLLPEVSDEDPVAELAAGRTPISRCYACTTDGVPVELAGVRRRGRAAAPAGRESRVAGRTDGHRHAGQLRLLLRHVAHAVREDRPVWTKMSFAAAHHNFVHAARHGMQASLYWPGLGEVTTEQLVLTKLPPMAYEGLQRRGVASEVRDRFLGVIEGRARAGRNGALQVSTCGRYRRSE